MLNILLSLDVTHRRGMFSEKILSHFSLSVVTNKKITWSLFALASKKLLLASILDRSLKVEIFHMISNK